MKKLLLPMLLMLSVVLVVHTEDEDDETTQQEQKPAAPTRFDKLKSWWDKPNAEKRQGFADHVRLMRHNLKTSFWTDDPDFNSKNIFTRAYHAFRKHSSVRKVEVWAFTKAHARNYNPDIEKHLSLLRTARDQSKLKRINSSRGKPDLKSNLDAVEQRYQEDRRKVLTSMYEEIEAGLVANYKYRREPDSRAVTQTNFAKKVQEEDKNRTDIVESFKTDTAPSKLTQAAGVIAKVGRGAVKVGSAFVGTAKSVAAQLDDATSTLMKSRTYKKGTQSLKDEPSLPKMNYLTFQKVHWLKI